MRDRTILIDASPDGRTRAALIEGRRLEDLLLDPPADDTTPAPGEIYWARVDRLVPKMHGAFLRLTPEQAGFLRETQAARQGSGMLVQVVAHAEPGKATPVTSSVLLKGPRVIYTPHAPGVNVSRQIRAGDERERLSRAVTAVLDRMDNLAGGFIIRTAAEGAPEAELEREVASLIARAEAAARAAEGQPAPGDGPVARGRAMATALREWAFPAASIIATPECQRLLARRDAPGAADLWGSEDLLERVMRPEARHDGADLFDQHGVRDEIETLRSPRVDLPSGGWMAVEATRAMVTVDVNTAAEFSGGSALTANLEAARELPRQLRLRGLGGQVIVDFAPLKKTDRRRVEDALRTSFRRDPVETTLAGWTPLGNFEIQRKRERRPLIELLA